MDELPPPERPRFLVQEPNWPSLAASHRQIMASGWEAFARSEFGEAARAFRAAYQLLLRRQPQGHRFHKGESLHNLGLALMWAGKTTEASDETLAAFIEDALSLAEESPRPHELDRPAAHNLVFVFGFAGPWLANFALTVRRLVRGGQLVADPHDLLRQTGEAPRFPTLRVPGDFVEPPERRVFIGGWYGRLNETLRPLRDHIASVGTGFEGIIAADFATPAGWGEDEVAKALMGMCHFGVFEVSESAGQIEEIAFSPETMRTSRRMMAVFDKRRGNKPGISAGMTLEKLKRWRVRPRGYRDEDALNRLTARWLEPPQRSPAARAAGGASKNHR